MRQINSLDGRNNPHNWDKIHRLAQKIDARQNHIEAFLPLISKDGYQAKFEFVKTNIILAQATEGAAEYHYDVALDLLEDAIRGDKRAARKAYNKFQDVQFYKNAYKDANSLKDKALEIGQTHVLVDVANNSQSVLPISFDEILRSVSVKDLNSTWKRFYVDMEEDSLFDYRARLEIIDLDVSPERETIEHYTDTKRVKDGWKYVLDNNGNVLKDTLGNDIKEDNYIDIHANVVEIFREKAAYIEGRLVYRNIHTGQTESTRPISVEAVFSDYAGSYRGDKRALGTRCRNRLKAHADAFPDDLALLFEASENLKGALKDALYELRI